MPGQYQPGRARRSGLRVFWIIWCCFWALIWLAIGLVGIFELLLVPLSLLAILIPVGRNRDRLPDCARCAYPAAWHVQGRCPAPAIDPGR
jgi:hypothetical protein